MTISHTSGWSTTSESFNCASEFNGAPINSCVESYTAVGGGSSSFKRFFSKN